MFDDTDFSEEVRSQILGLMYVMYEYGITEVHMGGLMRILGIPDETAKEWDDKVMCLDADFAKYISEMSSLEHLSSPTLH